MPYGIAARVATNEMRQMTRDHQVGCALKRTRAIACSFYGLPAVIRLLSQMSSTNDSTIPVRAIVPSQ